MIDRNALKVLKEVIIFGLLLSFTEILFPFLFRYLPDTSSSLDFPGLTGHFIATAVLLSWGLKRVANQLPKLHYGFLLLSAFGMLIMSYHFHYLYELLDYYVIHPVSPQPTGNDMEKVMDWIYSTAQNPAPSYNPFYYLFGASFYNILYALFGSTQSILWAFFFLITGNPAMPLWVSGVIFLYLKRKQKNNTE